MKAETTETMRSRPARAGFTLTELLVVVALVLVVITLAFGPLMRLRHKGMDTVCRSNLHQWSIFWMQYRADHGGKFTDGMLHNGNDITWHRGQWIEALRLYWNKKSADGLLRCPKATTPRRNPGTGSPYAYGSQLHTYRHADSRKTRSSYGINCWVYYPPEDVAYIQRRDTSWNWRGNESSHLSRIPLFLDSMWRGAGPMKLYGRDRPPDFQGQWSGYNAEMNHVCIDRHGDANGGRTNCAFMDGHVESIPLKKLWWLRWSRNWEPGQPNWSWPLWMSEFPEPESG